MKAKTIKRVLEAKFEQFLASITDDGLRERVAEGTIITGGCIASMLLREPVNDYDLYFRNISLTADVARYYVEQFKTNPPQGTAGTAANACEIRVENDGERVRIIVKSAGIAAERPSVSDYRYFEGQEDGKAEEYTENLFKSVTALDDKPAEALDDQKPEYRPVFLSGNAITLSEKVQVILRFYGEPEEIHANYDFRHCMSYWTSWDKGNLVLNPSALESLLSRELVYVGSKYPLCSIIRTRKFLGRGWTINAGQYLKMAMQLNDLDLKNLDVLEDQLTGVDAAYFMHLIDQLRATDPEKINASYISTIIDRIF